MKKTKKRAGKPRKISVWFATFQAVKRYGLLVSTPGDAEHAAACTLLGDAMAFNAKEARRLAAWLLKFADWSENEKEK
jgi:hypothetical protein